MASRRSTSRKKGRNTQDFAPSTTPPGLKLVVGNPRKPTLGKQMHGRHVTYVPGFFCDEEETEVFGKLMAEVRAAGSPEMWVPWHEKSHFIANDRERHGKWKDDSPVFCAVIEKIARYFEMDVKATRFNWYRNAEEWKPYHHDAAAVKKDKAKTQNCTIAVSFGATRDVAFEHAKTKTTVFLPQTHGSAYCFGHDVNVEWRHGVPQVPEALRGAAAGATKSAAPSSPGVGGPKQKRFGRVRELTDACEHHHSFHRSHLRAPRAGFPRTVIHAAAGVGFGELRRRKRRHRLQRVVPRQPRLRRPAPSRPTALCPANASAPGRTDPEHLPQTQPL